MLMNASAITVAHAMPGRVRLKVAYLRHDAAFANELRQKLAALPGVQEVELRPRTGSVVILYDTVVFGAGDALQSLLEPLTSLFPGLVAEDANAFVTLAATGTATAGMPSVGESVRAFFAGINDNLRHATGGSVDLNMLLPLTLFALGVRSLVKSHKLTSPTWYDFLWFALGTYFMLNPKPNEKQR